MFVVNNNLIYWPHAVAVANSACLFDEKMMIFILLSKKKHIFLLVVETLLFIHIHFFSSLVFRLKRMEKKEKKLCGLLLELTSIYLWHHHKSKHLLHGILILLWSIRFFIFRQIHLKNVYILRCGNDEHWTPIKKTECI